MRNIVAVAVRSGGTVRPVVQGYVIRVRIFIGGIDVKDDVMVFVSGSIEYIQRDLDDLKRTFVRLGFHLWENSYYRYYEYIEVRHPDDYGGVYKDVNDFAMDYFGLSRSTCSRLMAINRRFCDCSMYLLDKYQDYGYSQLSEMLSMDDDIIRCVRPSMSVLEIRRLKQKASGGGVRVSACDVVPSQVVDVTSAVTVMAESPSVSGVDVVDSVVCDVAQGEPEPVDDVGDLRDRIFAELSKLDRDGLVKLLSLISELG